MRRPWDVTADTFPSVVVALTGPLVWAAHLALAYGVSGFYCVGDATAGDRASFWSFNVAVSLAALATLAAFILWQASVLSRQGKSGASGAAFLPQTALALALLSLAGVVWNSLPSLFFFTCEASR